ncbi:MAG TPA: GntG family PLP-dependent aldolase [Longimicrobiaceae bacterium]|nr:GntG family PLP-dependent aldolase [Longimicrobiaceae bacterium]
MPDYAPVDLRSDTVTRPTPEMRRVIAEAEVGDAVLGDDPTVEALERYAAELLGKERALYFPSGIMANQTAVLSQAPSGTEAIIDSLGHVYNYEEGAAAAWGGVQMHPVWTENGLLTAADVAAACRPNSPYSVQTSLVCLENTHNSAGGRVLPLEQMRSVVDAARERSLRVHLDGARLPNASVAAGLPMRAWAEPADTVMVALSKGLGAPVGSLLAGDEETMERAWRLRRRLGGGMRQAGLLAAAGLYALKNNLPRLAEDHARARRLAEGANAVQGLSAPVPETNIVMIDLDEGLEPQPLLDALAARAVWMTQFGPRRLRAVTHMDVDDAGIERAARALEEVVEIAAPA